MSDNRAPWLMSVYRRDGSVSHVSELKFTDAEAAQAGCGAQDVNAYIGYVAVTLRPLAKATELELVWLAEFKPWRAVRDLLRSDGVAS